MTDPTREPVSAATLSDGHTSQLLAMIGRISTALGLSEEEQSCANGDAEILNAIEKLKTALQLATTPEPMRAAVRSLLDAIDAQHDTKSPPQKYGVPYAAVNRLHAAYLTTQAEPVSARPASDNTEESS